MKKLIYISILFLSIFSCTKSYNKEPKDLLTKSDMVEILTDLYISQQAISQQVIQDHTLKIAENSLYIFKDHHTTHKIFENSFKYYYSNPTKFQKILDKVIENLENQISEEEKKKREVLKVQHNMIETEQ